MKAARRLEGLAKRAILGLLVATFVFAPLSVMPVSADGGSNGQPGVPPDTTMKMPASDEPVEVYDPLVTSTLYLSVLRFIEL